MSTDETENRAGMERRATDDDRLRAGGRDDRDNRDLDRDGVPDHQERRGTGRDSRDLDRDGVPDNQERRRHSGRDLDRDGVPDNQERRGGAGAAAAAGAAGVSGAAAGRRGRDRDGDGVPDREERGMRSGRDSSDLDRDGVPDNQERPGETRAMPAGATTAAAPAGAAAYAGDRPRTADGRPLVAPGFARGRMHVGINWGAAFFGWLVAIGLAVVLTALVAAIGTAVSVSQGATTVDQAAQQIQNTQTVGVAGVVLLAVIAFVSYYGGGYVAARMSRFDGPRQGFAVWLWAIIVAIIVAILAAVAGARYDVLSTLNTFPRIPVNQGDLTVTGIVALVLLLVITLLGAMIGGAGGMRYHRRLERAEADFVDEA